MCTFSIDITERDPGLDSMIGVWKDHLFGQIKKLANLDSGHINNQMTGTTRTAYTLLVQSMVTLGMMCLAIIASILLVLQVLQVIPVYFLSVNNQTIIFFVSKITPNKKVSKRGITSLIIKFLDIVTALQFTIYWPVLLCS